MAAPLEKRSQNRPCRQGSLLFCGGSLKRGPTQNSRYRSPQALSGSRDAQQRMKALTEERTMHGVLAPAIIGKPFVRRALFPPPGIKKSLSWKDFQSVEKVAERHFFELSQVLPLAFAPGRQNLQSMKPSGFSSVLTHTPQGAFSCPCGAIHLVSSESGGT